MDFRDVISNHLDSRADVTICTTPVAKEEAAELGILKVDNMRRVTRFIEKAIIDKNMRIEDNVTISPEGLPDSTSDNYSVRDGVIVIPKSTFIPSDTTVGISAVS